MEHTPAPTHVLSSVNEPESPRALPAVPARAAAPLTLALDAIREQRAVLFAALPFIVGSYLVGPFVGWPGSVGASFWVAQATLMGLIAMFWLVLRERFARDLKPVSARAAYPLAWRRARESQLANDRLAAYAVVLLVLPLVVACYTGWKTWLGTVLPFRWDGPLMRLDRVVHLGHDPWRLVHPILGREWVTDSASLFYETGWAATLHGVITWQALRPPSSERTRFLVACTVAWPLIGNVAAAIFMSAGPCYYRFVVPGPDPYQGLISYVHATNDLTRQLQSYLWRARESGQLHTVGGGVSAMPSMHLVMVTLAAMPLWKVGRGGRLAAVAIVIVTLIASVHLGWHYAVDGYAGVLGALLIWFVTRWIVSADPALRRRIGTTRPAGTPS